MNTKKFIDIKYENLNSELSNILLKYYNIDKIPKFNIMINNNILYIKELNEYIYFDKNIQFPGDDKFKIEWKNFEDNQNIEPKFEKIISRYFDLNNIQYVIDGKCIKVNYKNNIENIYFDQLVKRYNNILQCYMKI